MVEGIRRATSDDAVQLTRLNAEVQALHATMAPELFKPEAHADAVTEYFLEKIGSAGHEIGIFDGASGPIGYIWIELQERDETAFTRPWRRTFVHHLTVAEEARRKGVATALLQWAEWRAREAGMESIALDHLADNAEAQAFYDHYGFATARVMRLKKL